jgi:hypothetical protein
MATALEQDLLRQADVAMDLYDKAQTSRNPAAIASARGALEHIRGELEKFRDAAKTLDLMKLALSRPVDAATGAMIKTKSALPQKGIDYRKDRFDKLERPGALSK